MRFLKTIHVRWETETNDEPFMMPEKTVESALGAVSVGDLVEVAEYRLVTVHRIRIVARMEGEK